MINKALKAIKLKVVRNFSKVLRLLSEAMCHLVLYACAPHPQPTHKIYCKSFTIVIVNINVNIMTLCCASTYASH